MKASRLVVIGAVTATAAVALWAVFAGDGAGPAAGEAAVRSVAAKAGPEPEADQAEAAVPALPSLPAGNALPALAQAQAPLPEAMAKVEAVPFAASDPRSDFTFAAPKGHDAKAMRELAARFEKWTKAPENANAQAEFVGMDCRQPPCVMALKFNSDRDGGLLGRAEAWLTAQGGVGTVTSYTHRLDPDHLREWFFFNPHPAGSKEHHLYAEAAFERIRAEQQTLPGQVDPSAALSAQDRLRGVEAAGAAVPAR